MTSLCPVFWTSLSVSSGYQANLVCCDTSPPRKLVMQRTLMSVAAVSLVGTSRHLKFRTRRCKESPKPPAHCTCTTMTDFTSPRKIFSPTTATPSKHHYTNGSRECDQSLSSSHSCRRQVPALFCTPAIHHVSPLLDSAEYCWSDLRRVSFTC